MIAKFPGKCARTGRAIRPGDVITFTRNRKAVFVSASYQHDLAINSESDNTHYVSDTVQFGDRTFYRNRNGRCEDAPCCGCCTI